MANIVDRRDQASGGTTSRERLMRRNHGHNKRAVDEALNKGNITDIGKGGIDVTIPKDDIREPTIHHGKGGVYQKVLPGNKEFNAGDRLKRPQGGGGRGNGNGAGQGGDSDDGFTFHMSEKEFLEILFEELELPNMTKRSGEDLFETRQRRAGFASTGMFPNLHLQRSKRQQMGRISALSKVFNEQIIELLSEKKSIMLPYVAQPETLLKLRPAEWVPTKVRVEHLQDDVEALLPDFNRNADLEAYTRVSILDDEIANLDRRRATVPRWNESTDLRFRSSQPEPLPISRAAMICKLDVSSSMDEETKTNAKLFFFLLHRFLKTKYGKVDVVFIRHTTEAEEVDEQEFFYGKKTGGTTVSSALELELKIIKERYSDGTWNIYGAQASDGDNWGSDNQKCDRHMRELIKLEQAHFYTEITTGGHQEMWETYRTLAHEFPDQFFMGKVERRNDIYPLFRKFFEKRLQPGTSPVAAFSPA